MEMLIVWKHTLHTLFFYFNILWHNKIQWKFDDILIIDTKVLIRTVSIQGGEKDEFQKT
jgi:hypothetical protein